MVLPRLAPPDIKWTATRAASRHVPHRWGEMQGHVLVLKDTRRAYWNNRLTAPNKFVYSFPSTSNVPFECDLRGVLKNRVRAHEPPLRVRLFSTPGSRNEYYGEWVVTELRTRTPRHNVSELHLTRLEEQSMELAKTFESDAEREAYRSRNEARHARELETFFPPSEWIVRHEPETLLDMHQPSVVDGMARDVTEMTASYTCDFVVAHRKDARRVCVESKPHESHVDAAALGKGRLLRDRTLARVLVMVGDASGPPPRWYDFGPPGTPEEEEHWHTDFESLCL